MIELMYDDQHLELVHKPQLYSTARKCFRSFASYGEFVQHTTQCKACGDNEVFCVRCSCLYSVEDLREVRISPSYDKCSVTHHDVISASELCPQPVRQRFGLYCEPRSLREGVWRSEHHRGKPGLRCELR